MFFRTSSTETENLRCYKPNFIMKIWMEFNLNMLVILEDK